MTKFYVDVHANGRRKLHVVFDGMRFFKVGRLTDIPLEAGDVLYMDVLSQTIYEDVLNLLSKGVKVYRLRRTYTIKEFRSHMSFEKTDENDAKLLSSIGEEHFTEVTVPFIELMKLLDEYYIYLHALKTLRQHKNSSEQFHEARLAIRRGKDRLAKEIVKKAEDVIPEYRKLCETLRLSYYGKVALADLLLHVDFSRKLRKILCYVGLYKPNNGRYNHRMKKATISLAISHYRKHRLKAREARLLLKTIKQTLAGGPA